MACFCYNEKRKKEFYDFYGTLDGQDNETNKNAFSIDCVAEEIVNL